MRKRIFSAIIAFCIALPLFPATAFAAQNTNPPDNQSENVEYIDIEPVVQSLETSAPYGFSLMTVDNGKVDLASGNHEKWIDRVNLPDYAKNFYEVLEEAVDNDGTDDFLIDDKYFDLSGTLTTSPFDASNIGKVIRRQATYNTDTGKYTVKYTAILAAVISVPPDDTDTQNKERNYAAECIDAAYNAFDRDHPEVFWKAKQYGCSTTTVGNQMYVFFMLNAENGINLRLSNMDENAIKEGIESRDQNVETILNSAPSNASRYETLNYFNTWLTEHNQYNTGDLNNGPWDMRECVNALEGKIGTAGPVCESYARAFKVLCDKVNIPCVLVDGEATSSAGRSGEGHMWNYVQMEDEKWYAADVTWDDPTVQDASGAISTYETDRWLLLGKNTLVDTGFTFIESHPVENHVSTNGVAFKNGPELNDTAYATLTYSDMPETGLTANTAITLTATRSPVRKTEKMTYTYAVTSGTLPAGLNIDASTGNISGKT